MSQIWIVDDDDEMLDAVRLMLELLDHDVRQFRTARSAAKELMGGRRPQAMILDINMPQVSGIDLLEFLRMRDGLKEIPVVMLSTETADVQVDQALELGANAFIFKPVTLEELEEALDQALASG
jgi:DNA-binding NtrC family response regulator